MNRLLLAAAGLPASADSAPWPDLPRAATYLIALALVAIWMTLRIRILRDRDELRAEEGAPPLEAWRWLRWLADHRHSVTVLVAIALSLLAAAGVLVMNSRVR